MVNEKFWNMLDVDKVSGLCANTDRKGENEQILNIHEAACFYDGYFILKSLVPPIWPLEASKWDI